MNQYKRILLVEDNRRDVELTLAALDSFNLANEVAVVRDGAEALEYLKKQGKYAGESEGSPVVVLLDIKMPKVSGLQVLEIMKADASLKSTPVVMLTSSREEPDLVRAYELGVNAYVVKPVEFTQFMEAIKQIGTFWALINEPPPGTRKHSSS